MIGKLTGIIDEAGEDFAVIDVGGVGYVVHCSARVLSNLPVMVQQVPSKPERHRSFDVVEQNDVIADLAQGRGNRRGDVDADGGRTERQDAGENDILSC